MTESSEDDSDSRGYISSFDTMDENSITINDILVKKQQITKDEQKQVSKSSGDDIITKEKSLGVLAFNFVKVIQREKLIAIEKAAELLSKNMEPNKFKTKVF